MARFFRDFALPISATIFGVALALAILSLSYKFMDAPAWLAWYGGILELGKSVADVDGWNLWVMILSVFALIFSAFYFGEQIVNRRKFERLIATPKKSEFVANRRDLDALARKLPPSYKARVAEKENSFRSLR